MVLHVKVLAQGSVLANDESVTFEQLDQRLASLKKAEGTVLYYREFPTGTPHPNATRVIEIVIKNQLPISLATKPDFSDAVRPDGATRAKWVPGVPRLPGARTTARTRST